eukprot:1158290-Pelagomonas_calceolata.AAC.4
MQGILRAVAGAHAASTSSSATHGQPKNTLAGPEANAKDHAWSSRTALLTPSERRQLRAFLLQQRWFGSSGA